MAKNVHYGLIAIVIALLVFSACFAGCTSSLLHPTGRDNPGNDCSPVNYSSTDSDPQGIFRTTGEASLLLQQQACYDTGLLNYLETKYEAQNNVDLQITSQGTG